MPDSLSDETSQLLEDYLAYCSDPCGFRPPLSAKAETLRRVTKELQALHRDFFRDTLSGLPGSEPACVLRQVAEQLDAEGGLSWGRVVALVAFAGTLAERNNGCAETPRRLAGVLCHYLAQERREWLEQNSGWDGFYRFFSRSNPHPDKNCTSYNAIIAAAGVGLAGLALLLVR